MSRFILGLIVLFAFTSTAAIASSPYDGDLAQLSGELRSLMLRVDQVQAKDSEARLELLESLYNLSKRLHRLQEEAATANLELQRAGHPADRGLTFAASIAQTLDLALFLTREYLWNHDKAMHTAAASAARSARELMAAQ